MATSSNINPEYTEVITATSPSISIADAAQAPLFCIRCIVSNYHRCLLSCVFVVLLFPALSSGQAIKLFFPNENQLSLFPNKDTAQINKLVSEANYAFPDAAIKNLQLALNRSMRINYMHGKITSLFHLGNIYANQADYGKAMSAYREALGYIMLSPRDNYLASSIYNNIGQVLGLQGDYQQAADALYKAATINNHLNQQSRSGYAYLNIAAMLLKMPELPAQENTKHILYYLNLAEQYGKTYKNTKLLAYALQNKGAFFLEQKDYPKAFSYLQATLEIAKEHHLYEIKKVALISLGQMYLSQKQYKKALIHLLRADDINTGPSLYYINMNKVYLGVTYSKLKKYDRAAALLLQARTTAKAYHFNDHLLEIYPALIAINKAEGRFQQALSYYEEYVALKERLTGEETANKLNRLEVKFRSSEKDKNLSLKQLKITQQEKKLMQQKVTLLWVSMIALTSGVFFIFYYYHNKRKQKLQQEHIKNIRQREKIIQLKAVMNGEEKERSRLGRELHDGIGGMLASIKLNLGMVKDKIPQQTEEINKVMMMINNTVKEVRKTSHNLMPEVLEKHRFVEAVVMYCDSLSNGDFKVDIQIYGDWNNLNKEMTLLIYRIIQELGQNIIKHAEATSALIQLLEQDSKFTIITEDNGKGFDPEAQPNNGIGLQNIRHRVSALDGKMHITSGKASGTIISIEFDLKDKPVFA